MLTTELPADVHVAAAVVTIGALGVINMAAFVNDADDADVQLAFAAVKLYDVPAIAPLIAPPAPTVKPDGVDV